MITGGVAAQSAVAAALHVAVLITETVSEYGSAAYSVWVASSTAPTFACGWAIGISATGAHPARSAGLQVAPLITSISGVFRLPP